MAAARRFRGGYRIRLTGLLCRLLLQVGHDVGSAEFMLLVLRLLLVVLAVTAGIVACLTIVGCITGLVQGEMFQCVGDWVMFVVTPLVLTPLSVCLLYLARWVRQKLYVTADQVK